MTINSNILYGSKTEEKISKLSSQGKELVHILADFDKTFGYSNTWG